MSPPRPRLSASSWQAAAAAAKEEEAHAAGNVARAAAAAGGRETETQPSLLQPTRLYLQRAPQTHALSRIPGRRRQCSHPDMQQEHAAAPDSERQTGRKNVEGGGGGRRGRPACLPACGGRGRAGSCFWRHRAPTPGSCPPACLSRSTVVVRL